MQKIVTIGGGTGHFQLLKGLKNYNCELTAIANMSDDGGSSGRLRDEYGVLPPGDVRQCIVALSKEDDNRRLRELFNYRFENGHNMGNLIITALTNITGNSGAGIKAAGELLSIEGNVLPVTIDGSKLMAETLEGKLLSGQTEVSYPSEKDTKIVRVFYEPKAFIYKNSAQKIKEADKIVICPGDLYGSIIPNLIVEGMTEALEESKAKKIYVCNLFTKQGNFYFKAGDFVREIEKYSGVEMDRIIVNTGMPSEDVVKKYFSENARLVEDDLAGNGKVIRGEFAKEYLSEKKTILRHTSEKIARFIFEL